MRQLNLHLLGGFEARDARGTAISLPERKAQALLACLALPVGRWHSREWLAGLLWGRSAEEQARSSLRQTLSGLRRVLAEHDADAIVSQGDSLALDAAQTDSDVARLEALVAEASPEALAWVCELYVGELLEGFSLREEAYEEWLEGERRRVREAAVRALASDLDQCLSSENADRGIAVAVRLLALEPLREDVHRSLMRLYAQAGRRGAALHQYEQCRQILRQELGTGPEPETERLASDIRAQPRTEYAKCGDIDIAYQVLGQGPIDLVYIPGWVSHVEYGWEFPGYARFLRRLAAFSRLIVFDKRGTGLSEREVGYPTLEERMDDLRAVLDAVGSEKATLLGVSDSGSLACLFAASNPDRTSALVLYGCFAKRVCSSDYPWGFDPEQRRQWLESISRDWGGRMSLTDMAPRVEVDSEFHDWYSRFLRYSASRRAALRLTELNAEIDCRHVLSTIHVPTLVMRRQGDRIASAGDAEYLATHIQGARFVKLSGDDHVPFTGDIDGLVDRIREFVTGVRHEPEFEHVLLAVVCVGLEAPGGAAIDGNEVGARQAPEPYEKILREELARHHGRDVIEISDGYLLTLDGPARAVRCAEAVRARLADLGAYIRAGIHVGECEVGDNQVCGLAVRLATIIRDQATANQVLASRTVKDLTAGAGISFESDGNVMSDESTGHWELFSVRAH